MKQLKSGATDVVKDHKPTWSISRLQGEKERIRDCLRARWLRASAQSPNRAVPQLPVSQLCWAASSQISRPKQTNEGNWILLWATPVLFPRDVNVVASRSETRCCR